VQKTQAREDKKAAAARRMASRDRPHLRSELLGVMGELGSLVSKEEGLRIAAASATVGAFVRGIAEAMEGRDGTETPGSITVLGSLSDLAQRRMLPKEKALPFETPSEILCWFALYLERTLSKPDLRLT
jgi:hypothetical protein